MARLFSIPTFVSLLPAISPLIRDWVVELSVAELGVSLPVLLYGDLLFATAFPEHP